MVSAMQAGPCRSPLNSPSSSCSPSPPGRPRPPGGGAHLCFFFKFSSEDRSTFWASHSCGSFILRAGSVSMGGHFCGPPSWLLYFFFPSPFVISFLTLVLILFCLLFVSWQCYINRALFFFNWTFISMDVFPFVNLRIVFLFFLFFSVSRMEGIAELFSASSSDFRGVAS